MEQRGLKSEERCAIIDRKVPVAQWIEQWPPKPCALVRLQSGAFLKGSSVSCSFFALSIFFCYDWERIKVFSALLRRAKAYQVSFRGKGRSMSMPSTVQQAQMWITQWNLNPVVLAVLIVVLGVYLYSIGPLRRKHQLAQRIPVGRVALFVSGIVLLGLALITPLQALTQILFSAHMIQHMLLSLAVAPLLVGGLPDWLVEFCLRNRAVHFVWRGLTMPVIAAILFNANIWLWHAPVIMNVMMMNEWTHLLALALYVVTGMLFWWPLFGARVEGLYSLNIAGKLIYILLSDMPMVLLGAGLTFTPPLYAMYVGTAKLLGWSPAFDQQLGGLVMWIPGGIYLIVIASVLLIQWFMQMEKQQAQEDAELALDDEDDVVYQPEVSHT
jgi:cytochrome c oxidase assembly factor CtaG